MMKFKSSIRMAIPSLALLAATPLLAAEEAPSSTQSGQPSAPTEAAQSGPALYSVVTPKFFFFNYTDGPATSENNNHYFQQYSPLETLSGDAESGFAPDVDLDLTISDPDHVFSMQRDGFGRLNHRNSARFEHEKIGASANYSTFTSGSNGADVLDGTYKQPNRIERTNLGTSLTMKPSLLGDLLTATVAYAGYQRKGSQYETFVQGAHSSTDFNTTNLVIDETVHKLSLNLSASPGGIFDLAYEAAIERFNNHSGDDSSSTAANTVTNRSTQDMFYLQDSTQFTQAISASKQFGGQFAVAAGFSTAKLEQDTFLATTQPTDPGDVTTDSAYLTLNANATDRLDLEGHVKVSNRDNDSRYTGPTPNLVEKLNSLEYGLSANYRLDLWKSTLTFGLDRHDLDRDLPVSDGVFFHDETQSNEVFIKFNARPAQGVTVQVRPTYTWTGKTALPTEPENAFELKTLVSYVSPTGLLVSGYYNYKHQKNNELSITETFQTNTDSITQNIDDTFHTAGATLAFSPTENINASASLFCTRTDAETYYTSFARTGSGDINLVSLFDLLNYKVRAVGVVLSADWQATDYLVLRGAYSYTKSKGDTANTSVAVTGAVPAFIDSTIHAVSVGGEYKLNKTTSLTGFYQFEHYDDDAYTAMTGGLHTIMMGLSIRF